MHKRHARSTQKVSSRYQAVNHLRDYYSWITSRRQAQFLAGTVGNDFLFLWCVLVEETQKGRIVDTRKVINIIGRAYHKGGLSDISSEQ